MLRRRLHPRLTAMALLGTLACGGASEGDLAALEARIRAEFPEVRQLATADLATWLDDPGRPRPRLIDARTREEYEVSHLPGAVHAEDVGDVELLTGGDRKQPLVVYCSVGYRSSALAARLQAEGYTDVQNLEGSIFRWANEGRPLFRGDLKTGVVHPYDASWGRYLDRSRWSFVP